jgi:hypothetical protein
VHPQLPPALTLLLPPFEDFVAALKTDSWIVFRELAHFGHAISCVLLITSFSYCAPQSSQRYS